MAPHRLPPTSDESPAEQALRSSVATVAPDTWTPATAGASRAVLPARAQGPALGLPLSPALFLRLQTVPGLQGPCLRTVGYRLEVQLVRSRSGVRVTRGGPVWRCEHYTDEGLVPFPEVFAHAPTVAGHRLPQYHYELSLSLFWQPEQRTPDTLFATLTVVPQWGYAGAHTLQGQQERLAHLGYMTGYLQSTLSELHGGDPQTLLRGVDHEAFQQAVLNFQADTDGLILDGEISHPAGHTRFGARSPSPATQSPNADATAEALADAVQDPES